MRDFFEAILEIFGSLFGGAIGIALAIGLMIFVFIFGFPLTLILIGKILEFIGSII